MINSDIISLIIDFGLVILIWMTQLVVYPSFRHFHEAGLKKWHLRYTTNITILVMPLMTGQLIIHVMSVYSSMNYFNLFSLVTILTTWINTFFYAVPIHNQIDKREELDTLIIRLLRINWYRTITWTLVFLCTLLEIIAFRG